jgi:hypothetical protein
MTMDSTPPVATNHIRNLGQYFTFGIVGAVALFIGWVIFVQYRVQSQGLAL